MNAASLFKGLFQNMSVKALNNIVYFLPCHEKNYICILYPFIFKFYYTIKYYPSLNYYYLYGSDALLLKSPTNPRIP